MAFVDRRTVLRGLGGGPIVVALPPLEAMFDGHGTAWADDATPVQPRFVFWFNGNGYPERYWTPRETGPGFALTPCLVPLAPLRRYVHVVTGIDNVAGSQPGAGNGHTNSMSGLVSGSVFTGRGAGGPSVDQVIAARLAGDTRFASLQLGVASESFGESMQRNMSWAAANRPLPPEMLPARLFDRLFGRRDPAWIARQRSVIDAVRADAATLARGLGQADRARLDEHLASVRDLERALTALPADASVAPPDDSAGGDDWPRIALLQSDLLAHALATRQTRVASYMLTKCQSLTRFPWLGHAVLRHHDYTHTQKVPGTDLPAVRAMVEICRWHVQELAYLLTRLAAIPEGDGTLLDHCCVLFAHEHAEASFHKNAGHSVVLAGGAGRLVTGTHTVTSGTFGDLFLTVARHAMGVGIEGFPTARRTLDGIFAS
jgi:hypothetical protein